MSALRGAIAASLILAAASAFDLGDARGAAAAPQVRGDRNTASGFGDVGVTVDLEHALADGTDGGRVWKRRTTVTVRDALPTSPTAMTRGIIASVAPTRLDGADVASLRALVAQDNAYSIRLPSNVFDPSSPKVVASVPACALVHANFAELVHLQFDTAGHVVALGYTLPAASGGCATDVKVPDAVTFTTSATARRPVDGPFPQGKGTGFRAGKGSGSGAGGAAGAEEGEEKAPPKSFFMRYWYYIVPAMIVMTLGGGEPPPAQGGGSGTSGGGGGGGAAGPTARR